MADEQEQSEASEESVTADAQDAEAVATAEGDPAGEEGAEAGVDEALPPSGPTPHDFRSPSLIRTAEMRKLKLRHEEFARSLTTRLAIYLRMEFDVEIANLKTLACEEWIRSLPNPTHLTSFTIETLKGIGLIQVSPSLAMTMVDRLMGGPGEPVTPKRELSEIETVLVDEAVQLILKEWSPQMPLDAGAKPTILGHETNARFIQPASDDTQMLVISLRMKMGELTEGIEIGLPFPMVERMVRRLSPLAESEEKPEKPVEAPRVSGPLEWNPELAEVVVPVTAEWEEFALPAGRVAGLKVGDTLEMDRDCVNNVQVRLARVTKFVGRLGAHGKNRAIQLTAPKKN